jgi:hypothetical protein
MWIEGNNPKSRVPKITEELLALKGELPDEQARATLAKFLYANPAFTADLIAGIKMFPFQEVMIKGWMQHDYNMAVLGRGLSKSWCSALFAMLWAIFNPKNRVVIVSFAFRASRRILEQVEKFVNDSDAIFLKSAMPPNPTASAGFRRSTDEWKWTLPNGSTIQCLPLGDGTKIRGIRADTLIVDEFAYLPEGVITEILQPFLVANNKIKEQREIQEVEDRLVAAGQLAESQRTIIEENIKIIFLSSACYQFEHMFKRYNEWIENIKSDKDKGVSYFVARMGYEAAPPGLVNMKIIEEAKQTTSEAVFDREYRAIFTDDSGGYFKASKLEACTIPVKEFPTLELIGEPKARYIMAIDVATSGAEDADHFAICVLKLVEKGEGDGKKTIPMVVHSYAVAGASYKDHIQYLYYILKSFNVVYIAIDASQGDEVEFLNAAIQSKLFKDAKLNLCDIDADFKGYDFKGVPTQIKRSYSLEEGRIIHKQPFSSEWQRFANEHMQGVFDRQDMRFAAKICPNSSAASRAAGFDMSFIRDNTDFVDMSPLQFAEVQDRLIDMTKRECCMIKPSLTDMGRMRFQLPQHSRRQEGPTRDRKDSYSALLLGIYATKVYLESQEIVIQTGPKDFPYQWAS